MRNRRHRGLTLIEVLVALSILAICLLALVPLFGMSVRTNASSGQLATANTLAREKLEELIEYPSTDPRLAIPTGATQADSTNSAYCANDLPKWWQPSTGMTSYAASSPGGGWYPFPCTRTYTVQAFALANLTTPVASTNVDESGFTTTTAYYRLKLVTVTVQPAGSPLPGLRRTVQSAFVKFRLRS